MGCAQMGMIVPFGSKEEIHIMFDHILNEHVTCFKSLAQLS
jgi:hypothetical protein